MQKKIHFVFPPSRRTRGFSLVELLIVVGIVAILSALLFPALRSMSEKAASTKCVSKIRQLGAALLVYQSDHDGFFPPNATTSQSTYEQCWIPVMRPYLGIQRTDRDLASIAAMADHLTCPSEPKEERPVNWYESNYALSMAFGTDGTPRKVILSQPASTVMIIDSIGKCRGVRWTPAPYTMVGYRHANQANMMFFDGHMEHRKKEEIPTNPGDLFWGMVN